LSDQLITIGRIIASDIREAEGTGLFFPVKPSDPALLLVGEANSRHAIKLSGSDCYNRFPISLKTACAGLFVPDTELRVDLSSRADASKLSDTRGTIILSGESLALVCGIVGDTWSDPEPFELPFAITSGSDATRIAFARWTIGIVQDDKYVPIWEPEQP
jgi:hypothetical protein